MCNGIPYLRDKRGKSNSSFFFRILFMIVSYDGLNWRVRGMGQNGPYIIPNVNVWLGLLYEAWGRVGLCLSGILNTSLIGPGFLRL